MLNSKIIVDEEKENNLDPVIAEGYKKLYEQESVMEIKVVSESKQVRKVGVDKVKVAISIKGSRENPQAVRIDLTSEVDTFFYYVAIFDEQTFQIFKKSEGLNINLDGLVGTIIKMLKLTQNQKEPHQSEFVIDEQNFRGKFSVIEILDYKEINLINIRFGLATEEMTRYNIMYRYSKLKGKHDAINKKLFQLNSMLNLKNPTLLDQMKQTMPYYPQEQK